jgi:aryl-alcohol dehydrogenase-like predicted oxidoreductase
MKSLSISEKYGWAKYVGHQVYYSLVGRDYEYELMPLALDQNVGALVWSKSCGRMTGRDDHGHFSVSGSLPVSRSGKN